MQSELECLFEQIWNETYPDFPLQSEVKFYPNRRFRFDFLEPRSKVAIEINGGNYAQGRHTRASALESEYEKMLLAASCGYTYIILTYNMIENDGEKGFLATIEGIIRSKISGRDFKE